MAYHLLDTIVAVGSPPGGGARAIVRLSGPSVADCVERLFSPNAGWLGHSEALPQMAGWPGHSAALPQRATAVDGNLTLPGVHSPLPADLYFWPNARSYTGEPVAEFHTLGSRPLVDAVLRAACASGARLAQPGEFTLRAFLAGRIDLTQAEGVLGVIDAANPRQLDVALDQLAGGLSRPLHALRERLIDLLGHLEAGLDFADEELPFVTPEQLRDELSEARRAIADLGRQLQSRHRAGELTRVVLVGRPNAGKSSLFNALARRARAIVSHEPGTTRDYLSAAVELAGVQFQLIDTGGICPRDTPDRESADTTVEQAIEEVARRESRQADVRIHCIDVTQPPNMSAESQPAAPSAGNYDVLAYTKADLVDLAEEELPGPSVSSTTGQGLDALRARLRNAVLRARSTPDHAVASTATRCGQSVQNATAAIDRALAVVDSGGGEELIAAEIRVALDGLGRVAGTVCADDVLDRVFSRFCIGK
ncbi:MAG: tRNA modification GTPase [Pirellulales bacterium]|nr:tRNA modification GTPase [Pirellulales bacterium]